MSEPQVWHNMVRKYVTSEEEGRGLMAHPQLLEMLHASSDSTINRKRAEGFELTQVHHEPPQLVVNLSNSPVLAGYTHYIQMLSIQMISTALALPKEPT